MVDIHDETPREAARDEADLARFGYKQELRRTLGVFSSFAVAFSYISPSTGIFTLFALGLTTIGGVFFWSWPIVAIGQFIIALGWAELSSHYPVAGSVFQWTKYLSGKTYSWFAGWIYLFAGILTVTSVCVTLPLAQQDTLPPERWLFVGVPESLLVLPNALSGIVCEIRGAPARIGPLSSGVVGRLFSDVPLHSDDLVAAGAAALGAQVYS